MSSEIRNSAGIRHIRALDGLRGVALLGVLFFHSNGALPGGYLGVDLFFVLSGFLITSLLLAEQRANGFIALSAFWFRRARRLFPALLLLMPAIALYARLVAKPDDLHALGDDALATLGYVANWRAILSHKSYWQLFASPSPLEHTWSLSIEEQFYVLWPLLVVFVLRRRSPRFLLGVTLALMALSVVAMIAFYNHDHVSRVYLGTDTRAAGILAGAALAMVLPTNAAFSRRSVRLLDALGFCTIGLLSVAWWKLEGESWFLYHGGFWLSELGALVLITCAVLGDRSLVARLLSIRPLTAIGTVSYGVYLWHWPVNVMLTADRFDIGLWLHVARFATTFAVAYMSYRLVELPIRKHGVPFGRPIYTVPAVVAFTVLLLVRATYARELPPPPPEALAVTPPNMKEASPPPPTEEAITLRVMVLGDSTANSIGWAMRGVHRPGVAIDLYGQDGCTMLEDNCRGDKWVQHAQETKPDLALLNIGGAFLHDVVVKDGIWLQACKSEWHDVFEANLSKRVKALAETELPVVMNTVPYPVGPYDSRKFRVQVDCINDSMRKIAKAIPGVKMYELGEQLCPGGTCPRKSNGTIIREDGVHYSMEGGFAIASWVLGQMQPEVAAATGDAGLDTPLDLGK